MYSVKTMASLVTCLGHLDLGWRSCECVDSYPKLASHKVIGSEHPIEVLIVTEITNEVERSSRYQL